MIKSDLLELKGSSSGGKSEKSFAHYAEAVSVTEGYVLGTPVIALCGEVFAPSRNPERLKVCPICRDIASLVFLPV